MPLEDELEALCRLHTARAELVLSGDLEDFAGRVSMVEAYAFRDEALVGSSGSGAAGEGTTLASSDVPSSGASASCAQASSRGGDADGVGVVSGGAGGVAVAAVGVDASVRRLAAVENCLDAFDRCVCACLILSAWGTSPPL